MNGHAACPKCDSQIDFQLPGNEKLVNCLECGHELNLDSVDQSVLESCPVCSNQDFYRVTQLNPQFGLFMVGSCFLGFLACVYFIPDLKGFLLGAAILLSGAVLDRLMRMVLPEVAICYYCKTVYSNVPNIDDFEPHDQEKRAEVEYGTNQNS